MKHTWKKKYNRAFGLHLKGLRLSKNITQEKLSKKSGVSTSHISRIERGEKGVRVTTIRDLAVGLKVHPKDLVDFKFELPAEALRLL
jgi:transcriptional regulator with XRE-family HTH domain